jgi:hypothetical protein
MIPVILLKELAEMKVVSYTQFTATMTFIFLNIFQLFFRGTGLSNFDTTYVGYLVPKLGKEFI